MLGTLVKMNEDEMTAELRVNRIFELMDVDGDDLISLDEFISGVQADPEVMRLLLQMDSIGLTPPKSFPSPVATAEKDKDSKPVASEPPVVDDPPLGNFSV